MAKMTFEETMSRLMLLIRAGHPVIYIISKEETRVFDCIARIVNRLRAGDITKRLWRWSQGQGLEHMENPGAASTSASALWLDVPGLPEGWAATIRPVSTNISADIALKNMKSAQNGSSPDLANSVVVFYDLHPFLGTDGQGNAGPMVRPLRNAAGNLRDYYDAQRARKPHVFQTVIVVAPTDVGRSIELNHEVVTVEFPLPETAELQRELESRVGKGGERPDSLILPATVPEADLQAILGETEPAGPREAEYGRRLVELIAGAGRGLTLTAYKQGLNMIWVEDRTLRPAHIDYMLYLKADTINNNALQYTPRVDFDLGGLQAVKEWVQLRRGPATSWFIRSTYRLPPLKGAMLLGASGGGKSQLAKLMAKEFNLALLRLDIGSLFGSYVGESEQKTREALRLAEALAPVVLWIDEIDKAFAGAGAHGAGDSGVSARVFGHFLTWLAEKQDDVFVVVTANDFNKILGPFPEFGRKGRFDEIFWVGVPSEQARREIFTIYLKDLRNGYLQVSDDDIELLRAAAGMNPPAGEDTWSRFLSLLSSANYSGNMTGAEIQHAINEALYKAYELDLGSGGGMRNKLTGRVVGGVLRGCRERALYREHGPLNDGLVADTEKATNNHWILV